MRKRFLFPIVLSAACMCACQANMVEFPTKEPAGNVSEVTLSSTSVSLSIGLSTSLTAFIESEDDAEVTWVNGNPNIISLLGDEETASITALATGETFVTAIAGSKSASCKVTVSKGSSGPVVVNSISLNRNSMTIDSGTSAELIATVNFTGNQTPVVDWSVANSSIVSIIKSNNRATIKGEAEGTTRVTASCGGSAAYCDVTVEGASVTFSIRLSKDSLSLKEGGSATLSATTKPADATVVWKSSDEGVAKVSQSGVVTASKAGTAVISASITNEGQTISATCNVSVTSNAEQDDYAKKVSAWSKPGHIYFHYLRNTDQNYDRWALWLWNSYPVDDEGLLYGANPSGYDLKNVAPHTIGWMSKGECGETGTEPYADEYGRIIDVNLAESEETLIGGKTGNKVKLISGWTEDELKKNNLGFLIVDQSKMTGEDMWVSDGGAEVYIKKIGKYLENGADSYMHVYCVEGNVAGYKLASGKQEVLNPTLTDDTGKYRSKNDISDLRYDAFSTGVSTSSTFKEDRPGVGYQIFVPSFADSDGDGFGDLQGIISRLDYLDSLGVDVLWLTPIQESNSYHGYDVTDYYKIDSRFGTLQDYQELLFKAHQRGMKVLMDMVINHTSKSNVLYKKSQRAEVEVINGKTINYRDMYLWKYKGDKVRVWDEQDPTTSEGIQHANFVTKNVEEVSDWYKDGTSNYYYFGKFGSGMAELNYSSQATRDYMTDMCKYWLSFGLDGFRLDAIKHIYLLAELDPAINLGSDFITYDVGWKHYYNPEIGDYITVPNDYSYDRNLNVLFWKQFAGTIKAAYPNCFFVGENFDGWDARMCQFYEAIDSQFDFQTYYALNEKREDAIGDSVKKSIDLYRTNRGSDIAINGAFTSNHDVSRMMNHAVQHAEDVDRKYNRHLDALHYGDVTSSNFNEAISQSKYYAAISILTPGCSWIYYGDEIGLCGNVNDKVPNSKGIIVNDHGNNVDRWYRQPMRWTDTYGTGGTVKYQFSGMEVLWDSVSSTIRTVPQQEQDPNSLLSYFKLLTATKGHEKYPTYGWVMNSGSFGENQNCAQLDISDGTRKVRVAINNSNSSSSFDYMAHGEVLGKSKGSTASGNTFTVEPHGFLVVEIY
ncbi:MAG: Ig-like domain-containing protein [Bacilli bacterium]|nr:Ig-like domain-containing protein [Bacilli bacterium]